MLDIFGERTYGSPPDSSRNGPGHPPYVIEEEQIRFFKRNTFFLEKKMDSPTPSEGTLRVLSEGVGECMA